MKRPNNWINHFAFWFVAVFATPLFIAANNQGDILFGLPALATLLAVLCLLLTVTTAIIGRLTSRAYARRVGWLMLAMAFTLAIQANIVHELFFYGNFNGEAVSFRNHGQAFWIEWYGFLAGLVVFVLAFQWLKPTTPWLAALPIASSTLLLLPSLLNAPAVAVSTAAEVDPAVFEFSRNGNVIHLLPDGFQSDIAEQVLNENPELAARFEGFTFFANHLGMYQGTAPAVPALLTGQPFEFDKGHDYQRIRDQIHSDGYPERLKSAGYRLDYALISTAYCSEQADSCVSRPFNDMKPRGYYRHHGGGHMYALRILADLTLFRLMPMRVKEDIYDGGHWMLADTQLDGSAPWPDPVLREWVTHMEITDGPPVYKWYHYIGTHIPPHWDAQCQYHRSLDRSRDNYLGQTHCVLQGIAALIDELKARNLYDKTAIVISGDHGCSIEPADTPLETRVSSLLPSMMGSARPAFMAKPRNRREPLRFSDTATSLLDIAPTVIDLAGLPVPDGQISAFDSGLAPDRKRQFVPYSLRDLFGGNPVPHAVYEVNGDVRDGQNWSVRDIQSYKAAPRSYDPVNYRNGKDLILGARFTTSEPDKEATWVNGRQLAFLIAGPAEGSGTAALKLALHLPKWLPEQSLSLSLNGTRVATGVAVEMTKGYWAEVAIDLPEDLLKPDNNFINVEFEQSAPPPGMDHWQAAALLRSIRLIRKDA